MKITHSTHETKYQVYSDGKGNWEKQDYDPPKRITTYVIHTTVKELQDLIDDMQGKNCGKPIKVGHYDLSEKFGNIDIEMFINNEEYKEVEHNAEP